MWQVETIKSLEGIFPGALINRGKKKKKKKKKKKNLNKIDSLYKHGRRSFLESDKLVKLKASAIRRNLACNTHYDIRVFCLTKATE